MNDFERLLLEKHTHAELCVPEEIVYKHSDLKELIDAAIRVALDELKKEL